ncbi:hypothetical protein RB195_011021 [Necator americanus]|uniref:Uncharacterized protein n=1 Tax=Necator americanus TaxID=51031 RepID=A0ABR1D1C2_NECAM
MQLWASAHGSEVVRISDSWGGAFKNINRARQPCPVKCKETQNTIAGIVSENSQKMIYSVILWCYFVLRTLIGCVNNASIPWKLPKTTQNKYLDVAFSLHAYFSFLVDDFILPIACDDFYSLMSVYYLFCNQSERPAKAGLHTFCGVCFARLD